MVKIRHPPPDNEKLKAEDNYHNGAISPAVEISD